MQPLWPLSVRLVYSRSEEVRMVGVRGVGGGGVRGGEEVRWYTALQGDIVLGGGVRC